MQRATPYDAVEGGSWTAVVGAVAPVVVVAAAAVADGGGHVAAAAGDCSDSGETENES